MNQVKFTSQSRVQTIYNKVIGLDLEPIIVKLMDTKEGQGWSLEKSLEIQYAYQQFLALNLAYTEHELVPNHNVDLFWHQHALDTEKYRRDCLLINANFVQQFLVNFLNPIFSFLGFQLISGFIDHFPYFGMRGDQDQKNLEEGYAISDQLSTHHFGQKISNENMSGCQVVCHYCKSKSWTDRPTLASVL